MLFRNNLGPGDYWSDEPPNRPPWQPLRDEDREYDDYAQAAIDDERVRVQFHEPTEDLG